MVKKLVSKAEFSRVAGVSQAAVTKACSKSLAAACEGKRIDLNHPLAVKYVKSHAEARAKAKPKPPLSNKGFAKTTYRHAEADPMYEKAEEIAREHGKTSIKFLRGELKIGHDRASLIAKRLNELNVTAPPLKENPAAIVEPPEPEQTGHVRGRAAAKKRRIEEDADRLTATLGPAAAEPEETEEDPVPENLRVFADMTLRQILTRFGTEIAFKDYLSAMKEIETVEEKRLKNAKSRSELISRDIVVRGMIDPLDTAFRRILTDGAKTVTNKAIEMVQAGAQREELEHTVNKELGKFLRPAKDTLIRNLKNAQSQQAGRGLANRPDRHSDGRNNSSDAPGV